VSLPPQSPQKLAAGGLAAPQAEQNAGNSIPHAVQNLTPLGLTWRQPGHSIEMLGGTGSQWTVQKVSSRSARSNELSGFGTSFCFRRRPQWVEAV